MKSSFPNSPQFSPTQTPLPELLHLLKENQTDRQKIREAIAERFFAGRPDTLRLADNTTYALSEYGLIDKPADNMAYTALTQLGEALAEQARQNDLPGMYEGFARHILLDLRGLDLVQCVDDLVQRGTKLTKQAIAKELAYRGFHIPRNGTHLNGMRQWLEMAGLVDRGSWQAKPEMLQKLLGDVEALELDEYARLTNEQRAFALALARLNVDVAQSNKVADYATALYGAEFPKGGLPQSTLFALRDIGLITCEKTTGGQGAKPYLVRPTDKLRNEFLEPIFRAIETSAGSQYRKLIRMPFSEILATLTSKTTHQKGLGLEALAFYLGRLIGLQFVKWRLRSSETGGGELDVIMEGANLVFSRWQIQCKNSEKATLEDIAKELGLATIIRSNVIMVVTTGSIGEKAREFAAQVMRETNHQVVLLSRTELKRIESDPSEIASILTKQSEVAMTLKREQLGMI